MVHLEQVYKAIGSFSLRDISFDLPEGYICGLIGENGAGKTTLLHILAGLYKADKGTLSLFGKDYLQHEAWAKQQIGTVFHGDWFVSGDSLVKNADGYGRFYERYDGKLLRTYLSEFQLDAKRKYKDLSKGEQLKFALAFALSHQPKLLLLDEPSANFDREFREQFHHILREFISDGTKSVILSTHITSDVERFADYILFLQRGKQQLFGDIETIRADYRMVFGETYKIRLLKDSIIYMGDEEDGQCSALVKNCRKIAEKELKQWEPSVEELMYGMTKGGAR